MKVSKVVLVVVALHVLVIGGIFIFEGCSRVKTPAPDIAGNESLPGSTNLASALPSPTPVGPEQGLTPAGTAPVAPVAPVATVTPVAPAKTYAVKKGDSLWKIAKAEKVTVDDLAKANNLSKNSILKLNQKLTIPAGSPKTEIAAAAPVTGSGVAPVAPLAGGGAYEVQIGDSLWKIAKNQGVTVTAIKVANSLKSDKLQVGQKLTIPAKTTTVTAKATPVAPAAPAGTAPVMPSVTSPGATAPVTTTPPPGSGPAVAAPGIVLQ